MGKILGAAIFKENGFTLAEVLITLGIIGVVAAMTIPTLMTHLNHIKLQSQFKEGYSLLAQAVKMYNEDEEATRSGLLGAKEFSKYFKGATICTSQDKMILIVLGVQNKMTKGMWQLQTKIINIQIMQKY